MKTAAIGALALLASGCLMPWQIIGDDGSEEDWADVGEEPAPSLPDLPPGCDYSPERDAACFPQGGHAATCDIKQGYAPECPSRAYTGDAERPILWCCHGPR